MLKGAEVLWPERESYELLMNMRLQDGPAAFDAEKQNAPTGEHEAMFPAKELVYWDDEFPTEEALLASIGEHLFFMGCDPSLGRDGVRDGDDTAIVTVVKELTTGRMCVLDADIRRRKPADIILALTERQTARGAKTIGIEANHFQSLLFDEIVKSFRARGLSILPLVELTHTRDKVARIQSLQAYVASGRLRFSRKHARLIEQLTQFPHSRHDDGPDALEMAVLRAANHFVQPKGKFRF
jgi:predicted phage terminase large subunit-like protein